MGRRRRTRGKQEVIRELHENKSVPVEAERRSDHDGPVTNQIPSVKL